MVSFDNIDLDSLEEAAAKKAHDDTFKEITEDNANLINGKCYISKYTVFRNYINTALSKTDDYIKGLPSDAYQSRKDSKNYMLNFAFVLDENDSNRLGLLTTVVDGAGDHVLYDSNPGEDKYMLIEGKSQVNLTDSISAFEKLEAVVYEVNDVEGVDDHWHYPVKHSEKVHSFSKSPNLGNWLNQHDVDSCLKFYRNYAKEDDVNLNNVNKAINYVSIWELEDLLVDSSHEWIGIFPVIMKSTSKVRPPKSAHFMSLLFIPFNGKVEGEDISIDHIDTNKPFVLSGKGYPRAWKDTKELATRNPSTKLTFNLSEFWKKST